jgi:hypothetical protein
VAIAVSSEPFHALAASLRERGFAAQASRLEDILNGTWTTSTELIGELGLAVVAIRKECRGLTPAQKTLVRQCLKEVRKAWPGFGWPAWLPFRPG